MAPVKGSFNLHKDCNLPVKNHCWKCRRSQLSSPLSLFFPQFHQPFILNILPILKSSASLFPLTSSVPITAKGLCTSSLHLSAFSFTTLCYNQLNLCLWSSFTLYLELQKIFPLTSSTFPAIFISNFTCSVNSTALLTLIELLSSPFLFRIFSPLSIWSPQPLYEWMIHIHYPPSIKEIQSCYLAKSSHAGSGRWRQHPSFCQVSPPCWVGRQGWEGGKMLEFFSGVQKSMSLQCLGLGDWCSFIQQMASIIIWF